MKPLIFDSYALIAYLNKEEGHLIISELFEKCTVSNQPILISAITFNEVYYHTIITAGRQKGDLVLQVLKALPIEIVNIDYNLSLLAADYREKAQLSQADAYAVALTKLKKGILVTGDKEFKTIEKDVKITWI